MKPMKLNLSSMKKIGGDQKSSTFQHQDGHKIVIAHAALPALQRKQLEKMPVHMADGGDPSAADVERERWNAQNQQDQESSEQSRKAQEDKIDADRQAYQQKLAQWNGGQGQPAQAAHQGATESWDNDNDSQQATQQNPIDQVAEAGPDNKQGAPGLNNIPTSAYDPSAGYNQALLGQQQQMNIDRELAAQNAKLNADHIASMSTLMGNSQANAQNYEEHQKTLIQDYLDNHINPNHYMENMKSEQKVGTAIGLFLGGLGSAFTHQGNPALDYLNKQIERDVEAQKSRLDQSKTLLGANEAMFKNKEMAINATKLDMSNLYMAQAHQEALKLGTPQAMANFNKLQGMFKMQYAPMQQQLINKMTVMQEMNNPQTGKNGLSNLDPAKLVQTFGVPEARQKDVFDEIKNAQDITALTPKILDAFERGSSKNPAVAAQGRREFEALMNTTVKEQEGTARQAAFDSIHKNMSPSGLTAFPGENTTKKRTTMEYLASKQAAPTAMGYGIDLSKFASTNPKGYMQQPISPDQQALQWANSNPRDPRAMQIKQRLGVK